MTSTLRPEHPPARLSVGDDAFTFIHNSYGPISVLLDGQLVENCTGYDVEAGTVEQAKLDDEGRLCIAHDSYVMEALTGKVEARWRAPEICHSSP